MKNIKWIAFSIILWSAVSVAQTQLANTQGAIWSAGSMELGTIHAGSVELTHGAIISAGSMNQVQLANPGVVWSEGSIEIADPQQWYPIPQEGSISGTLIDKETGAPAQYVRIVAHVITLLHEGPVLYQAPAGADQIQGSDYVYPQWPLSLYRSTYSDAQGAFSFTNIWTESYYGVQHYEVEIQSPKYQQQTVTGDFFAGTNDLGIIEVSARPFYFERVSPFYIDPVYGFSPIDSELSIDPDTGVSPFPIIDPLVVRTTVVNTTGKKAYMRFWLTGKLERRDDSEYYGCSSEGPLKLQKRGKKGHKNYATYRLVPGENEIELNIKDYGPDMVISQVMINGGRSYSEPLMVSQSVPYLTLDIPYLGPWPGEPILYPGPGPVEPIPIPWSP